MTAVTKNTLYSAPYNTIYSIINDRNNISDPRSASPNRRFVYKVDPFPSNYDFGAYPYIHLARAVLVSDKLSTDKSSKEYIWTQSIIIRTVKSGSGLNREDQGHDDTLAIMDEIMTTFNSKEVLDKINEDCMRFIDFEVIQEGTEILIDEQIIIETIIQISYKKRIQVQ